MAQTKAQMAEAMEIMKRILVKRTETAAEDRCAVLILQADLDVKNKKISILTIEAEDRAADRINDALTDNLAVNDLMIKISDLKEDLDVKNKRIGDLRIEGQDRFTRSAELQAQRDSAVSALFRTTRSLRACETSTARLRVAIKRAKFALYPDMGSHNMRPEADAAVRALMILMGALEASTTTGKDPE